MPWLECWIKLEGILITELRMNKPEEDKERDHRITFEIVVDCYNEEERAA